MRANTRILLNRILNSDYIDRNAILSSNYDLLSAEEKRILKKYEPILYDMHPYLHDYPSITLDPYKRNNLEELWKSTFDEENGTECIICHHKYPEDTIIRGTINLMESRAIFRNAEIDEANPFVEAGICDWCYNIHKGHLEFVTCPSCGKLVGKGAVFAIISKYANTTVEDILFKDAELFKKIISLLEESEANKLDCIENGGNTLSIVSLLKRRPKLYDTIHESIFTKEQLKYLHESVNHDINDNFLCVNCFRERLGTKFERIHNYYMTKENDKMKIYFNRYYSTDNYFKHKYSTWYDCVRRILQYYENPRIAKKAAMTDTFSYFNMPKPVDALLKNEERHKHLRFILNKSIAFATEAYTSNEDLVYEISKSSGNKLDILVVFNKEPEDKLENIVEAFKKEYNKNYPCPWTENETWVYCFKPAGVKPIHLSQMINGGGLPMWTCKIKGDFNLINIEDNDNVVYITFNVTFTPIDMVKGNPNNVHILFLGKENQ